MMRLYEQRWWLEKVYVREGKDISLIADLADTSTTTIWRYLKKFGLIRNGRSWK